MLIPNGTRLYDNFTVTDLRNIYLLDPVSHTLECVIEEPQKASIENDQQTTDLTGKQGRKLGTLKTAKSAKITATNGIISGGAMAKQVGGEYELRQENLVLFDTLTAASDGTDIVAETTYPASGAVGSEILGVGLAADGAAYLPLKNLVQTGTAQAGEFSYDPATKKLAFDPADVPDGSTIIVQYAYQVSAGVLVNEGDRFSKVAEVIIDAIARDTCMKEYWVQFRFPKGDVSGTFSLAMGDTQTVQDLEINSIAGGCGVSNYIWKMVVVGLTN